MQRGLCLEEPDAGNLLVRVCGGAAWVTSGPTRKVGAYCSDESYGLCAAPSALIALLNCIPASRPGLFTAGASRLAAASEARLMDRKQLPKPNLSLEEAKVASPGRQAGVKIRS